MLGQESKGLARTSGQLQGQPLESSLRPKRESDASKTRRVDSVDDEESSMDAVSGSPCPSEEVADPSVDSTPQDATLKDAGSGAEDEDDKTVRLVGQIVDEGGLACRQCQQRFTSVSNLRRHAIRHLGWRRFKCRLCRFCSYNRSECNTHILRAHPERLRASGSGGPRIDSFITDLNRQAASVRSSKKRRTLNSRRSEELNNIYLRPKSRRKASAAGKPTVPTPLSQRLDEIQYREKDFLEDNGENIASEGEEDAPESMQSSSEQTERREDESEVKHDTSSDEEELDLPPEDATGVLKNHQKIRKC
nr:hypothetical protein BaRGS_033413 [Batillaria attramentaria]